MNRPIQFTNVDWQHLRKEYERYLTACEDGGENFLDSSSSDDLEHSIFEIAAETLYGIDFWKYVDWATNRRK